MFYSQQFQTIIANPTFIGHIHSLLAQGLYPSAIHNSARIYLEQQKTFFKDAELERFIDNNKWLFILFRCDPLLTVKELHSVICPLDIPVPPRIAECRFNIIARKHDREISDGYMSGYRGE